MLHRLAGAAAAALTLAAAAAAAPIATSVDPGALPAAKRTALGLYLTPGDAAAALAADPSILFVDVRDPIELATVGHAEGIDANVPLATFTHAFDAAAGDYAARPNPTFVAEVEAAAARAGRTRTDPVFVICRSGSRSAAAANALAAAGFTAVWNLTEGFEGDLNRETGRRDRGGWRNAGLPWRYRIDPAAAWSAPAR
jgi:rhodanese-related sulfurtransferase